MLSDIARNHMITFVVTSAVSRLGADIRLCNGGEGMNWTQNHTPTAKKLACMSQMCTYGFCCARSNNAGTCQAVITTLNAMMAAQGPAAAERKLRSGRDQAPASTDPVAPCLSLAGETSSRGGQGAPATTSARAAHISSTC